MATEKMQRIDATEILTSLPARVSYMQSFLNFDTEVDGNLIHSCKPVLAPLVNEIVDAVYDQLLRFDITAAAFATAQSKVHDSVEVNEIHRDHTNINFRKDFLKGYLIRLASNTDYSPTSKFWGYLDHVGRIHTGDIGGGNGMKHRKGRPALFVNYRDVNLLLGWVENAVIDIVMGVESLDLQTKLDIVKALNKFWWIQNDLFARHYITEKIMPIPGTSVNTTSGIGSIWAWLGYGRQ